MKIHAYKIKMFSIVLYGFEMWSLTLREEVLQNNVLRTKEGQSEGQS
jgi:hypothetical protein